VRTISHKETTREKVNLSRVVEIVLDSVDTVEGIKDPRWQILVLGDINSPSFFIDVAFRQGGGDPAFLVQVSLNEHHVTSIGHAGAATALACPRDVEMTVTVQNVPSLIDQILDLIVHFLIPLHDSFTLVTIIGSTVANMPCGEFTEFLSTTGAFGVCIR
jgi:hypothetical protein